MKRQSGELPLEDKLQYDGEMKETKTNIKKQNKQNKNPGVPLTNKNRKKKKKTNQMKISFSFRYLHY